MATHAVAFKSVCFYKVGHQSSGFPLSIALGFYGPRQELILLYSLIFVPSPTVIPDIAASVLTLFFESTFHASYFYQGFKVG